jgi:DNA replication protein DnaC
MNDDLEQLLANLHLGWMGEVVDREVAQANKEQATYETFLARLLRAQYQHRQESSLAYRIHQAKLPEAWTLESFPFKLQPGVDKRQMRTFAELDFIAKGENIVFIGPTGVGKTGLASAILLKALQNGYRGLFIRAQDLFEEMLTTLADHSSRKLVDRLARLDLIVCDELGYLNVKPEQSNIFFKLMEERYTRRSTIITTFHSYCGKTWSRFLFPPRDPPVPPAGGSAGRDPSTATLQKNGTGVPLRRRSAGLLQFTGVLH